MSRITNKGFAFYLDLAFASTALVACFLLMTSFYSGEAKREGESIQKTELETGSVFGADSIAKNSETGCAVYSPSKKRVEQGKISIECLVGLEGKKFGKAVLRGASISGNMLFYSGKGNCFAAKRLLDVEGNRQEVELVFCEQ